MKSVSSQKGMSVLGWVIVVLVVGLGANLAVKTIPHYVDFYTMSELLTGLQPNQVHNKSKREINETLTKRFKINNLRSYPVVDIIAIERTKGITRLNLHYIVTEHLAGNADLVLTFDRSFEFDVGGA